jgi:hypothetical protein
LIGIKQSAKDEERINLKAKKPRKHFAGYIYPYEALAGNLANPYMCRRDILELKRPVSGPDSWFLLKWLCNSYS